MALLVLQFSFSSQCSNDILYFCSHLEPIDDAVGESWRQVSERAEPAAASQARHSRAELLKSGEGVLDPRKSSLPSKHVPASHAMAVLEEVGGR